MHRFYKIIILAVLVVSLPFSAHADKEFIQKIQGKLEVIQQKASSAMEEVQKYKNELQNASTQATGVAGDIQKGVQDAKNGKVPNTKIQTPEGISKINIKEDSTKADKAIEEEYVTPQGQGDSMENFRKAQDKTQEILREAVSHLYSVGFTVRTNMTKETPTDNEMKATDQILQEANIKAMKCVQRLATIYTLEGLIQSYQMLEETQNITIDASQQEDGEKKE